MMHLIPVAIFLAFVPAPAATFPDAKHGNGQLVHVSGIPVLSVRGTPAEIGEQFGILAVKNAPDIDGLRKRFLKDAGQENSEFLVTLMARRLKASVPPEYLAEMEATCKAANRDLDQALFANTIYDLSSGMGCSTVVLSKDRNTTGGPILARNFDWLPTKGIMDHTLIVVYRPTGKRTFATITISPIIGCISGMNDAGLACTLNEVELRQSKDKSAFNWNGTPMMLAFRRVLEECGTVAEAEKLLRGMPRTTTASLTICDTNGGAVFEITPKAIAVRPPTNGVVCCTNHFCTVALNGDSKKCRRLPKLLALEAGDNALSPVDVFAKLDTVHQGKYTLQSMIFEPSKRVLHLKLSDGTGSATKRDAVRLELGPWFANGLGDPLPPQPTNP